MFSCVLCLILMKILLTNILQGRDNISVSDVKDIMQSKKLRRRVHGSSEDGANTGLLVRIGRSEERERGGRGTARSKSRTKTLWYFQCKEKGT